MITPPLLQAPITIFPSVASRRGYAATFADFLRLCLRHRPDIEAARRLRDDKEAYGRIKRRLPAATLSGRFPGERRAAAMERHSGYICIDIDHIADPGAVKDRLAALSCTAYVAESLSGRGVFALIAIARPECHTAHFEALSRMLREQGIAIDTCCRDVTRLRVVSYDPDARLRPDPRPFEAMWSEPPRLPRPPRLRYESESDLLSRVDTCCRRLSERGIDITPTYHDWLAVGLSLATLGEAGRDYFHTVSSLNPRYRPLQTDRKFTSCLSVRRYTIATFFGLCAAAGISPDKPPP